MDGKREFREEVINRKLDAKDKKENDLNTDLLKYKIHIQGSLYLLIFSFTLKLRNFIEIITLN